MSTIKQLIQLHLAGVSNRQIAKQLGIYKNTVNKYIRTLSLDPLSCQDLLTLDDPEYITPNVPLVSLTNVPDISLLNVPLFTGCN